ncbi:hypothetical protein QFC19_007430 [Naganishia cerealis]|uniref:Uncharacterized protein n=1 Tax=Naganishia cerealis TaxID=610337 RepID=A0ACC2V8X9_9TREE|nr:hypothetical protein QFC19_007430 [Naganishia cerealis]
MLGIFLEDLPFDLDTACPISITWQTSVEPEISSSSLVTEDEAEEKDEVFDYLKRRYWETLYLPEVRDSNGLSINLEQLDEELEGNQALRNAVEGTPISSPRSSVDKQQEMPSEKPKLLLDEASTRKKRKRGLDIGPATGTDSPLHRLLLTIPQLERKHRHGVAVFLSRFTFQYYGLPRPAESNAPTQRTLGLGTTLQLEDSKAEEYFSPPEMDILKNAIRTRYTSARAEDDMVALHRSVDAEVDQWYQETIAAKLRQETQKDEQPGFVERVSREQDEQPQDTRGGHAIPQFQDVVAKKQEMMSSVMMAKIKSLREQLERREYVDNRSLCSSDTQSLWLNLALYRVLLQVILLLVINHLYTPSTYLERTGDDDAGAGDDIQVNDLGIDYRTRKAKKKKEKKSRESSNSTKQEFTAETTRPVRRKRRTSVTVGTANEDRKDQQTPDPATMLDLFADRITLWQAIGVGNLLDFGSKANIGSMDNSNSMDFQITRDMDDQHMPCTSIHADSRNARPILPSMKSMEEWDWIQKFCVFGEPVASAETDVQQLQAMDDYDVTAVHTVNTDASAGGRERSLSRAASVASVTSRPDNSTIARKNAVMGNRQSVNGGEDSSRVQSNSQPPGSATLAFATPSKPRANQLMTRGSSNYTSVRDKSRQDQSATMQAQDISSGKAFGSGMVDYSAHFVAETPAVTGGRRMNLDPQVLGRNTSFSKTSKALWEHQRNSESRIQKTPFETESLETDDLADFMVDTDEEDDVPVSHGMLGSRFSSNIVATSRSTQGDQDVQEVPETPVKAH